MSSLCISSDFSDFYDYLNNKSSPIRYDRQLSGCRQRGVALKFLRTLGIKTIDIQPVSQYIESDGPLVVYTDIRGHNGNGKRIETVAEARFLHENCIASRLLTLDELLTMKFIQIGKRRYTLYFKKSKEDHPLSVGTLVDIKRAPDEYNRVIGLPIFSIDYISHNNDVLATDFNEVECLERYKMNNYISAEETVTEIIDALIAYNKVNVKEN